MNKLSLVEIEYSDLEFKEVVGSGGFGTVSKGRWMSENKVVAIKTMIVLDEREVSYISTGGLLIMFTALFSLGLYVVHCTF